LILRNAPGSNGRWILGTYHGAVGGVRPRVYWSPDGVSAPSPNVGWFAAISPEDVTIPETSNTEAIVWFSNPAAEGGPDVFNYPSLAADPRDERTIYLAFLGKSQSSNSGTNVDIMVARSTDGGENFSGPQSPQPIDGAYVLRLRDVEDLGDPEGALQFFPSITVDPWGTVHVLYYVAWPVIMPLDQVEWRYQIKLVSIENFSIDPHPTVSMLNVFPENEEEYFTLDHSLVTVSNDRRFLGHYMNTLDSRVCELYAGFIAREPNSTDGPRVFASRIILDNRPDCFPDPECYANCDESTTAPVVNVQDFSCFLQKYSEGCASPTSGPGGVGPCYPNCDQSTSAPFLNVADFTCFLQRFVQGCS
jgi:hypothetical protein